MFCSGCGGALVPGQAFCPQCGRPVAAAAPPVPPVAVPGFQFELSNYAGKIRALSVVWFIYGGLSLVLGISALTFANAFFHGHMGGWIHGGAMPPVWLGPAIVGLAWPFLLLRTGLCLVAAWGLMEHAPWGRIVAIVAAILNLIHIFPFGTVLGIWTLVMLVGYRNSTLYDQLPQA